MSELSNQQNKLILIAKIIFAIVFIWGCFKISSLIIKNDFNNKNITENEQNISYQTHNEKKENSNVRNESIKTQNDLPIQVDTGVYVKTFGMFDYYKNIFFVNFYIWFLMDENTSYHPENSIEITNGQQWERLSTYSEIMNDKILVQTRFYGWINHNWNMKYFPFDRQKIRVSLEDNISNIDKVKFKPLSKESKLSREIQLLGWKILNFDLVHEPHQYRSNFGDINNTFKRTSRLSIIFDLKREGWQIFYVYFIGYFVSIFLSIISFIIPKQYFGESCTLCLGAIFAGIGNKTQLEFSLSGTSDLSFSGIFTLCTFAFVIITTLSTILTHTLFINHRYYLASLLNYSVLMILMTSTSLIMWFSLMEAINS